MLVTQQEVQKASGILIIMFMFLSLMQRYQSHVLSSAVPGIEKQLVLIPFLYIALRVWDSVKYFMIVCGFPTNPCEESTTQTVGFIVIAILEVNLPVISLLVSTILPSIILIWDYNLQHTSVCDVHVHCFSSIICCSQLEMEDKALLMQFYLSSCPERSGRGFS